MNNYRPISILPVISRLFECILSALLRAYLDDINLLSLMQHGFRSFRSCQTALLSLTNRLFANRGNGYYSAIATLDYSKTFDCISHEVLIEKLSTLNFSPSCLEWFRSYLSGRMQSVKYNNLLSDPLPVKSGVAGGSVLAPQLFAIYIDDLIRRLPVARCLAYADDVTLVGKGRTVDEARYDLQEMINIVAEWSQNNSLTLNISKCHVMYISANLGNKLPSRDLPIMLNGQALSIVRQLTILGVTITSDLSWNAHTNNVCAKVNGRLAVLRRCGRHLNANMRLRLFNAFVKPVLLYCLPVWDNCSARRVTTLDKALLRSARYITGSDNVGFTKELYVYSNFCNFSNMVLLCNALTTFNIIHSEPIDDFIGFNLIKSVSQRSSRAAESNKIDVPNFKHFKDNMCFLVAATKHWNLLPNAITCVNNFATFRLTVTNLINSKLL